MKMDHLSLSQSSKHNKDIFHNKIYIADYLPFDLKPHLQKLSDKLSFTKSYPEIVTNRGIIIVESGEMNMLKYQDATIEKNGIFLLDRSKVSKENVYSQIPYDYFINHIVVNYYGYSSNVQLVVEGIIGDNDDFIPRDFYFLANDSFDSFDFDNKLIAEEIEWFLSVLK